jgi:metallophosphoesterase (TIGR00282 family)
MKILFFGDVVGKEGRKALRNNASLLKSEFNADVLVANGENSAGGLGINVKSVQEMLDCGIDVITTGNHAFHWKEWRDVMRDFPMVLFPANYPGMMEHSFYSVKGVTVLNIQGRVFMDCIDNPFNVVDQVLAVIDSKNIKFVDFHAEATSEKIAMGYYLDGRVDVVVGTHTHVQTADEHVLPNGTVYITDVGMTGPFDNSVLGMDKNAVISKFVTNLPARYEVARGRSIVNAVLVTVDEENRSIDRISFLTKGED